MSELSAEVGLRPTRIGFLVSPTDLTAIRKIMRACQCLWGGVFNPIIPVFKRAPDEWKPEIYQSFNGAEVARGYVRFFEPDVYVESKRGLLEEAGLGAIRQKHVLQKQVITLKEFLEPQRDRNWADPAFGLNISDVLAHIYKTEQRFLPRDKQESIYVSTDRGSCVTEALFGFYPNSKPVKYIEDNYKNVYQPTLKKPDPNTWREVFLKGAITPLRITGHGLDIERYWYHDLIIFVFDPTRPTDLIDLWNIRLEPRPVLPIPVDWFSALKSDIRQIVMKEHRPVIGNPHGIMHNATIEFGRSIKRVKAESLINSLKPTLPSGALVVKYWRNAIWADNRDDRIHRDNRLKVVADQRRVELAIKGEEKLHTTFETLAPKFANEHGSNEHCWVNSLKISNYSGRDIATVLPFNTFNRTWPRLGLGGDVVSVGSEGWIYSQKFSDLGQYVSLFKSDELISSYLQLHGIVSELSEPGHIARQMLDQLGGLWGVHLLADIETLKLLNSMATSLRRKSNESDTIEEAYDLRTASIKDWSDLISKRKSHIPHTNIELNDYTKNNVIRLGLETECPHCKAKNWNTLTTIDYQVSCERCLKTYDFPQASLKKHNQNFTYRVIGPFSMPDFGRGSYSALLTLRALKTFKTSENELNFSTSMNLSFDKEKCEVDFVAWYGRKQLGSDSQRTPELIIGESKSLGKGDLIKAKDLAKLKLVAQKISGTVVVVSVLRDHFTPNEKKLLQKFVHWGRRVNIYGEPTNPVILLTSHELTLNALSRLTRHDLKEANARFADYDNAYNLAELADATQKIHLGLPSFHQTRREYWDKRLAKRKASTISQI